MLSHLCTLNTQLNPTFPPSGVSAYTLTHMGTLVFFHLLFPWRALSWNLESSICSFGLPDRPAAFLPFGIPFTIILGVIVYSLYPVLCLWSFLVLFLFSFFGVHMTSKTSLRKGMWDWVAEGSLACLITFILLLQSVGWVSGTRLKIIFPQNSLSFSFLSCCC